MGLTVRYTSSRGGGGENKEILFHERVLMTLVICVLIDAKFNRKC